MIEFQIAAQVHVLRHGRPIKALIGERSPGIYEVHFTPDGPGQYKIHVNYNDHEIKGIPVNSGGADSARLIADALNCAQARRSFST